MKFSAPLALLLLATSQVSAVSLAANAESGSGQNGVLAMARRFTNNVYERVPSFSRRGVLADELYDKLSLLASRTKRSKSSASPSQKPKPKPSHKPKPKPEPKPSGKLKARSQTVLLDHDELCPVGLTACPIFPRMGSYECIDTFSELESCGGCASLHQGEDCTALEGAGGVACVRGACLVLDCIDGYETFTSERGFTRCKRV